MNAVNSVQVQSTNDASSISKASTASKKYINDDFIQYFVGKKHSRASLIHLGYYARAIILHRLLTNFIKCIQGNSIEKFQIISCGAGFDTSYWRLSELNLLRKNDLFIEIDFLPVIEKKISLINQSEKLKSYLDGSYENKKTNLNVRQMNSNYFLIAADLCNTEGIKGSLDGISIDYGCPTLFLSECVITYMKVEDSDGFISWMSKKFPNSSFINYEQIHPHDGFGMVMMRHFNKLQSSLFSVVKYPDCKAHLERYKNLGFQDVTALSEWEILRLLTTDTEHKEAITLEQFDEFEEFHLKCVHYVVAISSKGGLNNWPDFLNLSSNKIKIDSREVLSWERLPTNLELYGHSSCTIGNEILLFGGITRQQRSSKIYEIKNLNHYEINHNAGKFDLDIVHGTVCHFKLSDKNYIFLYGGRKSPNKICNEGQAVILEFSNDELILKDLINLPDMPTERYRGSTVCHYHDDGKISFWIFGGRTSDLKVGLSDLWRLTLKTDEAKNFSYECKSVRTDDESRPCCRLSHSSVVSDEKSDMFITCGLESEKLTVLNDIWKFNFSSESWNQIHLKSGTLLPRYGHTSHVKNDILYLLGGVNTIAESQPGLALINLKNLSVIEYAIPTSTYPFLFFNHSSHFIQDENNGDAILIIGGGGNCFSFGTFINDSMQLIKLNQFF